MIGWLRRHRPVPYPKSRLPGPAVRLFDLQYGGETTVRAGYDDVTRNAPPSAALLKASR